MGEDVQLHCDKFQQSLKEDLWAQGENLESSCAYKHR